MQQILVFFLAVTVGTMFVFAEDCAVGQYFDGSQCLDCEAGKYRWQTQMSSCNDCSSGRYTDSLGNTICSDCTAGKYSATMGLTQCTDCEAGKYAYSAQQSYCDDCTYGKFAGSLGNSICSDCTAGKYAATKGLTQCTDCEAGRYALFASACYDCAAGKFAGTGYEYCLNCDKGKYANQVGQASCTNCPAGTENGDYAATVSTQCVNCPHGRYSEAAGTIQCSACGSGKWTPATGSAACQTARWRGNAPFCNGKCNAGEVEYGRLQTKPSNSDWPDTDVGFGSNCGTGKKALCVDDACTNCRVSAGSSSSNEGSTEPGPADAHASCHKWASVCDIPFVQEQCASTCSKEDDGAIDLYWGCKSSWCGVDQWVGQYCKATCGRKAN